MRKRSDSLGLAQEPGAKLRVAGQMLRQNFDRNVTIEANVVRAIDFTHAARAQWTDDFVGT
jgi:hypothetical protein